MSAPSEHQTEFLSTEELIAYIKPFSERDYWQIFKKHKLFPTPIRGGAGCKQIHSRRKIDEFLKLLAEQNETLK